MKDPIRRRQRVALAVAVVCAILSTSGLLLSTLIKSPQQLVAESAAPPASRITATIERKVLTSSLITRGSVTTATRLEVTPTQAQGAAVAVVTSTRVRNGDEIRPGQVLVAVSGRPLIALPGEVPAYRDLKPGDSGSDVKQLQTALKALGHASSADTPGLFGPATKAAVRKLYAKIGFDAPDTGGPGGRGDAASLTSAREAELAAERAVNAMKARIAAGETAGPGDESLDKQLAYLESKLVESQRVRADLIAHTGTMLPLAEFVFVPAFPARIATFSARVGDPVKAPLIVISTGHLGITVKLRRDQAALVRVGMPVALTSETLGEEAGGKVESIGDITTAQDPTSGGGSDGAPYHLMTIATDSPLAAQWFGLDVRVTIISARTDEPVLVVPLSAVSMTADGRTTISTIDDTGGLAQVSIRAGVSGNGFVEITPLEGTLSEGTRVVVGGA